MRRWLFAGTAAVGLALGAVPAWGGGWESFWTRVHVDFHRNNAWTEPFRSADRASVREPFCTQTDNGWKMQNTVVEPAGTVVELGRTLETVGGQPPR